MCLRKLQNWSPNAAALEFGRFARDGVASAEEVHSVDQFREEVKLPPVGQALPRWLWGGRRLPRHATIRIVYAEEQREAQTLALTPNHLSAPSVSATNHASPDGNPAHPNTFPVRPVATASRAAAASATRSLSPSAGLQIGFVSSIIGPAMSQVKPPLQDNLRSKPNRETESDTLSSQIRVQSSIPPPSSATASLDSTVSTSLLIDEDVSSRKRPKKALPWENGSISSSLH